MSRHQCERWKTPSHQRTYHRWRNLQCLFLIKLATSFKTNNVPRPLSTSSPFLSPLSLRRDSTSADRLWTSHPSSVKTPRPSTQSPSPLFSTSVWLCPRVDLKLSFSFLSYRPPPTCSPSHNFLLQLVHQFHCETWGRSSDFPDVEVSPRGIVGEDLPSVTRRSFGRFRRVPF